MSQEKENAKCPVEQHEAAPARTVDEVAEREYFRRWENELPKLDGEAWDRASSAEKPEAATAGVRWIAFSDALPPLQENGRGDTLRRKVLVTNNINSRDAFGDPSHVWIGNPEHNEKCEWSVHNGGMFLTHWADISPAQSESQAAAGTAHIANEWADAACNAVVWLKNVRDGISTPADALAEMESNIARIRAIGNLHQPEPPAADERAARVERALAVLKQDYSPECLQMATTKEYVEDAVTQLIDAGYARASSPNAAGVEGAKPPIRSLDEVRADESEHQRFRYWQQWFVNHSGHPMEPVDAWQLRATLDRGPRTDVAGAVPHNILVSLECAALWLENGCDAEMAATEIRMAIEKLRALQPPSADAAAAPADEPSELEQVIECLGDDAATLRHSDEYVEMADNMEAAARLLESFAEDRAAEQICNRWPWQREASQDAAPSDAQAVEAVAIRDPNYVGGVKLLRDLPPQTKLYAAPQPHAQEVAQVRLTDERAYRMYEAAMSAMEASGPYQTVEAATAAVVRNLFAAPASAPVGPTDAQIKALTDKWAARWGTSSAWNIRRCIDNALREALALLKGDKQ